MGGTRISKECIIKVRSLYEVAESPSQIQRLITNLMNIDNV